MLVMRIHCCMLYDEHRAKVGAVASELLAKYCHRHGYTHEIHSGRLDLSRNASWNKVLVVRNAMRREQYDRVVWFDADCFIVSPEMELPSILPHQPFRFTFSSDSLGFCAGFFCVTATPWSMDILSAWWAIGPAFNDSKWEQSAYKTLVNNFVSVNLNTGYIGQSVIANPETHFGLQVPFAYHAWANRGEDEALADYREKLSKWTSKT